MTTVEEFAALLLTTTADILPDAKLHVSRRRDTVLEARIEIDADTFIQVYYNALTDRKSYALIRKEQRVTGYDNHRFWHVHPLHEPSRHVPCDEPTLLNALRELRAALVHLS